MKIICGIYKITNKINGKIYIGQSIDVYQRFKQHISNYSNSLISKAIRKYGIDNFKFEVIEECTEELLNEKEIYYISKFNSFVGKGNINGYGYNLTLGGEGGKTVLVPESVIDEYLSGETIIQISEKHNISSGPINRVVKEIKKNRSESREAKRKWNISHIWNDFSQGFSLIQLREKYQLVDKKNHGIVKTLWAARPENYDVKLLIEQMNNLGITDTNIHYPNENEYRKLLLNWLKYLFRDTFIFKFFW